MAHGSDNDPTERLGVIFTAQGVAYRLGDAEPVHLLGGPEIVEEIARLAMTHGRDAAGMGGELLIAIEAPGFRSVVVVRKTKQAFGNDWYDPANPQYEARLLAYFTQTRQKILERNGRLPVWASLLKAHLHDEAGRALEDRMIASFQKRAANDLGNPYFRGTSCVGRIVRLAPATARDLADDFFEMLYTPVRAA